MHLLCNNSILKLVIFIYYFFVAICLCLIRWEDYSIFTFVAAVFVGVFIADLISGLVHLYIDYQPLNHQKGVDLLFKLKINASNSSEFNDLLNEIFPSINLFDKLVYRFKVHHRTALPKVPKLYQEHFIETVFPSSIFLIFSVGISVFFSDYILWSFLAFVYIVASVSVLHADIIHMCIHGSSSMPVGVKIARFFQKIKFIYPDKVHNSHHKNGLSGFCFITGQANFLVNWLCKKLLERGTINSDDWYGIPSKANMKQVTHLIRP